jgi:uncharacterized protein with FMN-binding domain
VLCRIRAQGRVRSRLGIGRRDKIEVRVYNLLSMTKSGSNKNAANSLVSTSCAAVLAVYVAGYVRTQSAADRLAAQVAERRVAVPDPPRTASPIAEVGATAPNAPVGAPSAPATIPSNPTRDAAGKRSLITSSEPITTEPITTANAPGGAAEALPAELPAPSPPVAVIALPESIQAAEPPAPAAEHKTEVAPVAPPASMWRDGTYTGWGYSRHGDIEAAVVIEGGRIASATISQCRTRYSCSVIDRLPPQVAQRQSPDVDYVSGATQSADAFYGAVVAALGKAK